MTAQSPSAAERAARGAALATWFGEARRGLPWRTAPREPYRVWLSEVMLQQTQVSRVVDYFERFVARFPTVQDLAAADEDDVLSMWSGLGYYSRGRNLHRAARAVVADHGGVFPTTSAVLRTLPGVGDYTSAAVASLAGGERIAVVDGNVVRVLSRLSDEARAVQLPETKAALSTLATSFIAEAADPAVHNEALMELGALVCTPKNPRCGVCPLRDGCVARAQGTVDNRPVKLKAAARKHVRLACVVVDVGGKLYLERRSSGGLFRGLWEPITAVVDDSDDLEAVVTRLCIERGVAPPSSWPAPLVVSRTLTHRELRFEVMVLSTLTTPSPPADVTADVFDDAALATVGISSAVRAVIDVARSPRLL